MNKEIAGKITADVIGLDPTRDATENELNATSTRNGVRCVLLDTVEIDRTRYGAPQCVVKGLAQSETIF